MSKEISAPSIWETPIELRPSRKHVALVLVVLSLFAVGFFIAEIIGPSIISQRQAAEEIQEQAVIKCGFLVQDARQTASHPGVS